MNAEPLTDETAPLLQVQALQRHRIGPLTFSVAAGECLCIAGASGSGKSQLLRSIADLDEHRGSVLLAGVRAVDMQPSDWRLQVGLLPPESRWWLPTAGAHLHNGIPAALEQLELPGDILEQPVARLSSGQKQRLALLRLLSNNPRVLLLDEPTANLDPDNTRRVERLIRDYCRRQQAAVIWVSHDREQAARVADRSLLLADGELREALS